MKRLMFALLFVLAGSALAALEVAGVMFEEKTQIGNSELVLNGAGVRTKFFLKVYAMALYLPGKKADAAGVLAMNGAKRIRIVTRMNLSAEKLVEALVEGMEKNHSATEIVPLKARIEEFKVAMLAVKEAPKGAVILIDWLPETGTRLTVEGKAQGRDIPGEDFYRALLKVWLGDKPPAEDLKEALLGKPQ